MLVDASGSPRSAIVTTRWWGTPFVAMIATHPSAQRRGLGTLLLREVGRLAVRDGEPLGLIVTRQNPALALYESLGFVEHDRPG